MLLEGIRTGSVGIQLLVNEWGSLAARNKEH